MNKDVYFLERGNSFQTQPCSSFGWSAASVFDRLPALLSFDWLMTERWSSLDIGLTRWWGYYLGQLHVSHAFASGKYHDEIPATMQIFSTIDYQLKDFWMRIKADPESKN